MLQTLDCLFLNPLDATTDEFYKLKNTKKTFNAHLNYNQRAMIFVLLFTPFAFK